MASEVDVIESKNLTILAIILVLINMFLMALQMFNPFDQEVAGASILFMALLVVTYIKQARQGGHRYARLLACAWIVLLAAKVDMTFDLGATRALFVLLR